MVREQPNVTLFTLAGCGACAQARRLLRRRGIPFEEVRGDGDPGFAERLFALTGGVTVPQALIGGVPVGGADRLVRLDRRGVLRPLVEGREFPIARIRRRLPWRYEAQLVDREGRVLERRSARSAQDAARLAEAIGARPS
jgi:glutaredoxin 3